MLKIGDLEKKSAKKRLVAGRYTAEVTFCDYHPEYLNGSAIKVVYRLTNENGDEFDFPETFFNDMENPRTASFSKHLADIGIDPDHFQDFVGVREAFELKKNVHNNRTVLSIDPASRRVMEDDSYDV